VRGDEVLGVDEVVDIFRQKTAPAFEVALRLGAICAGAEAGVHDVLRCYSEALGVAYQIRDDLADLEETDGGGDVASRRPSIVLAVACRWAGAAERKALAEAWAAPPCDGRGAAQMRELIDRLGARDGARRLMESYKDRAIRSLCALTSAPLKRLLRRIVAKIFGDVEVMGCCNEHTPRDA